MYYRVSDLWGTCGSRSRQLFPPPLFSHSLFHWYVYICTMFGMLFLGTHSWTELVGIGGTVALPTDVLECQSCSTRLGSQCFLWRVIWPLTLFEMQDIAREGNKYPLDKIQRMRFVQRTDYDTYNCPKENRQPRSLSGYHDLVVEWYLSCTKCNIDYWIQFYGTPHTPSTLQTQEKIG